MRITFCVILFLSFFWRCGSLTRYISHVQNYVNLVSSYNLDGYSTIDFPPLADVSQAMVVNIDMHLYAVNGFDEVAGNIELVVAMEMSWLDEMSIIQSISFKIEDRAEFLVPYNMIWTPKLVLTNAIGDTSDVGDSAYLCRFDMSNKRISWKPRVVVSGSCTPDVTFYPFDKQQCDFIYTAWGFKADEILLTTSSNEWNLGEYGESGEWDIDSTSTEAYTTSEQSYLKFTIVMVRKPLYFAFNILLPILVLCLLNSAVFLLPAESGERVGFSVTCFLSFMVLLNMIMDIMPRSSNPISFLCYYLVVMMSNSGAMTLVTILLMRVYHKPEKSQVPKWMQRAVTFVNCGCAKIRCCVLCCRYFRSKCGCADKRICGCKKKEKSVSEDTLIEIHVDKDQNIIEKPVRKKKAAKIKDKELTKATNKCCFLSFGKNDKASKSKCCCGCIIGCKKCKKGEDITYTNSSDAIPKKNSPTCFGFLSGKRKNEDEVENDKTGNDKSKKQGKLINETKNAKTDCTTGCISFCKRSTENNNHDENKESNLNRSCFNIKENKDKKANKDQTVTVTCTTCVCQKSSEGSSHSNAEYSNLKSTEATGCSSFFQRSNREKNSGKDKTDKENGMSQTDKSSNISSDTKCFGFIRKTKVSSLDEADTEKDVLPVSIRSTDSKTLKVSFKGKDKFDSEETLLQRWDDAVKDTTNKKKSLLNPIDQEPKNYENEETNEDPGDDQAKQFILMTKSIRASAKEKEAENNAVLKSEDNDSECEVEIVRKTRNRKQSSSGKVKENLPRPVVHEKVGIQTGRRQSTVKTGINTTEDSEESEVESLADLEEEVTWPEVGRILDTFFFLAFAGGQAFLTVVFLVPLFTGDTKGSEN